MNYYYSYFTKFPQESKDMTPQEKGEYLMNNKELREHHQVALEGGQSAV